MRLGIYIYMVRPQGRIVAASEVIQGWLVGWSEVVVWMDRSICLFTVIFCFRFRFVEGGRSLSSTSSFFYFTVSTNLHLRFTSDLFVMLCPTRDFSIFDLNALLVQTGTCFFTRYLRLHNGVKVRLVTVTVEKLEQNTNNGKIISEIFRFEEKRY